MRRKDREMSEKFALSVVDKCDWAVMSLVGVDNRPYCVPLSIVREEDRIYFHAAKTGLKVDCLRHCADVCVLCVGDTFKVPDEFTTEYESAIVRGKATEVLDNFEAIHALKLICLRHTPTNMDAFDDAITQSLNRTAVWKISIDEITGKSKKYDENGNEMKFRKDLELKK